MKYEDIRQIRNKIEERLTHRIVNGKRVGGNGEYPKQKPQEFGQRKKKNKKKKKGKYWNELKQARREIYELKSKLEAQTKRKEGFYTSKAWRELRYKALNLYGRICMSCKAKNIEMHVDHIKPRSKFPELELDLSNLQILCVDCNLGKSNYDQKDYRPHSKSHPPRPDKGEIIL